MGTKLAALALCAVTLCFLPSCTYTIERPYVYVSEGVYAYEDRVWENGVVRNKTPTDMQALQFIPDDSGIDLVPSELVDYEGSLYSLSNYRELLLSSGYTTIKETRTCDILDTTLAAGEDRVRLIYQPSGRIRILFENPEGGAHILLRGA